MVTCACNKTSNKKFILDVGMEKEQKQELGWRCARELWRAARQSAVFGDTTCTCMYFKIDIFDHVFVPGD